MPVWSREGPMSKPLMTAALIVVGDEILSGSTKDENTPLIAVGLAKSGIELCEVRIVSDRQEAIVSAVNSLRFRYTYVLTTGGLGPTHDDITADSIAAAFRVGIDIDERAKAMMLKRLDGRKLDEARLRMARIPFGADLIESPMTKAPGFRLANVYVMAGVPQIMQAMFKEVLRMLGSAEPLVSRTVAAGGVAEVCYADLLREIAQNHLSVLIGSYPYATPQGYQSAITVRGPDSASVDQAVTSIQSMLAGLAKK